MYRIEFLTLSWRQVEKRCRTNGSYRSLNFRPSRSSRELFSSWRWATRACRAEISSIIPRQETDVWATRTQHYSFVGTRLFGMISTNIWRNVVRICRGILKIQRLAHIIITTNICTNRYSTYLDTDICLTKFVAQFWFPWGRTAQLCDPQFLWVKLNFPAFKLTMTVETSQTRAGVNVRAPLREWKPAVRI